MEPAKGNEEPVDPVPVRSTPPPGEGDRLPPKPEGDGKENVKVLPEGELSPDDQALKDLLEKAVADMTAGTRLSESLAVLIREVQTATASLTAVPKPLKFLRPHFDALKQVYANASAGAFKTSLADLLAVVAMTMAHDETRECVAFKARGNSKDIATWGHEFVRALTSDVSNEFIARADANAIVPDDAPSLEVLNQMVDDLVPVHIKNGAEGEAIDLLYEVGQLSKISRFVDPGNFEKVALYVLRLSDYVGNAAESTELITIAYDAYLSQGDLIDALRVGLKLEDRTKVSKIMQLARERKDGMLRKQLGLTLAAHRAFWYAEDADADLDEFVSNSHQSTLFHTLARELNVEDAKTPEDVYKSHLSETASLRNEAVQAESAKQNLASTFVNAFVNCGFLKDALVTVEGNPWIYKNKDHGMISATASLGMVLLWNVDEGMTQIDRFLYATDKNILAGALLALGICNCGVRDECEPALGMLPGHLEAANADERNCSALGLGLAYAGNPKDEIREALLPLVQNTANFETCCIAALALAHSFCGTGDEEVSMALLQALSDAAPADLSSPLAYLLCLALGTVFMGKQEGADAAAMVLQTVEHPVGKLARALLSGCAYAGTGNVLEVQKMLHLCTSEAPAPAANAAAGAANAAAAAAAAGADGAADASARLEQARANVHQSAAVVGIALITMGESVGREMAERTYQHLLQYGDLAVRRAVPLAIALAHVSHPDFSVVDVLSRLTHDADMDTAMNATLGLGLVGAGTNNSRIAGLLRLLASFYSKEAQPLFVVRLAQGLLHAGKGLVTMAPYHSDRLLMLKPAVAGILSLLVCAFDLKATLLGKLHYLFFALAPAVRPRMVMAVDDAMQPLVGVQIRVGMAVDVVGMAGKPKTITGFQTHASPALMGVGERAELADPMAWKRATKVLEGAIVMQKNPDADIEAGKA